MSFFSYVRNEVTRSYMLDHDRERYTSKREKMYTFMRIPRKMGLIFLLLASQVLCQRILNDFSSVFIF